jgi:hypothetical protein
MEFAQKLCLTQDLEVGVEHVCSKGDTRSAHTNLAEKPFEKRPHGKLRSQEMNGTNSQSCPMAGFGISSTECLLDERDKCVQNYVGETFWKKGTWKT